MLLTKSQFFSCPAHSLVPIPTEQPQLLFLCNNKGDSVAPGLSSILQVHVGCIGNTAHISNLSIRWKWLIFVLYLCLSSFLLDLCTWMFFHRAKLNWSPRTRMERRLYYLPRAIVIVTLYRSWLQKKKEGPVGCHPFLRCGKFLVFDWRVFCWNTAISLTWVILIDYWFS